MSDEPTPGQIKAALAGVFDRAAESYESVGVSYFDQFGARLVELVDLRPGDRVLDTGCGRGAATFAAAAAVGPDGHVLATDLAPGMVQRTRDEARRRGLDHVAVRLGDAEAPEADGPFDAVLSAFVLFMLPDPHAAMRRYRDLLRDGGRLGVSRFPKQPDSGWMRAAGAIMRHHPLPKARQLPEESPFASDERLEAALRDAGFASARTVTEPFETTFADREQWWAFAWSHGQRGALERVPDDELPALEAECFDLLADEVRPDGTLLLTQYVAFTVATR